MNDRPVTESTALPPVDPPPPNAPSPNAPSQNPPLTVFFDGACPLCRREIGFYRNIVGPADGITFCDVSGPEALALPPGLTTEAALARFHVVDRNGSLKSGAAAFAAMWRETPGLRLVGAILAAPPFVWIAEGMYRIFLLFRPMLQGAARRLERTRSGRDLRTGK